MLMLMLGVLEEEMMVLREEELPREAQAKSSPSVTALEEETMPRCRGRRSCRGRHRHSSRLYP